jgi:hypothetical protein
MKMSYLKGSIHGIIDTQMRRAVQQSQQDGYNGACELLMKSFTPRKDAHFTGAQVVEIILEAKGYRLFLKDEENEDA